ncbi:MAG TPA: deoxyhypusine synthase family protein, partial [Candidatus Deferrimicrobium sp.]|nr:deoxyhypusine synthase family protein [Candidatus Deferrimicrobium sp.]
VLDLPEFQAEMGTAEFHYRLGRYMAEREKALAQGEVSVLAAAWRYGVPVYTSSPGDSSIGMNVAAMRLGGRGVTFDVSLDVNETAAIVYDAKRRGGKSAVWILGGGSPKNFMLQTEPQIQEVLGLDEKGHDYFLQITDARPDTGGLSGATPSEAVSWGKVDPDKLPDTVVCYLDATVALPLLCAFAFDRVGKRTRRRLYDRRGEMLSVLGKAYRKAVNAAGVTKKRKVARKR